MHSIHVKMEELKLSDKTEELREEMLSIDKIPGNIFYLKFFKSHFWGSEFGSGEAYGEIRNLQAQKPGKSHKYFSRIEGFLRVSCLAVIEDSIERLDFEKFQPENFFGFFRKNLVPFFLKEFFFNKKSFFKIFQGKMGKS